jgi:hypothetical protein
MDASQKYSRRRRMIPAIGVLGALLWGLVEVIALQKASWRRIF